MIYLLKRGCTILPKPILLATATTIDLAPNNPLLYTIMYNFSCFKYPLAEGYLGGVETTYPNRVDETVAFLKNYSYMAFRFEYDYTFIKYDSVYLYRFKAVKREAYWFHTKILAGVELSLNININAEFRTFIEDVEREDGNIISLDERRYEL